MTVSDQSVATTIIHIAMDPDLPGETGARWKSFSWQAVDVWLSPTLTRPQQLEALGRVFDEMHVEAAAQARTGRSELACKEIIRSDQGVDLVVCGRCSREFRPDSSPALTLCWQCEEIEYAEAGCAADCKECGR